MIVVDMKGKVFFLNKAASEMLACDPKQALGQHVNRLSPTASFPEFCRPASPKLLKNITGTE